MTTFTTFTAHVMIQYVNTTLNYCTESDIKLVVMMDYSSNETRRFESAFAYAAGGGGEVRKRGNQY